MWENSVCEWVQDSLLQFLHVKGKISPTAIFTKEMQDRAQFRRLQDSFICWLSDFLQQSLLDVHLSGQQNDPVLHQIIPSAAASSSTNVMQGSYLSALYSLPLCNTLVAISHLLSMGHQIVHSLHLIVPSIVWHFFSFGFISFGFFLWSFSWMQGWGVFLMSVLGLLA